MDKKRILIADDDQAILDAIQLMLQISDYTVDTVRDGTKVITRIKNSKPDLLLLDLWMSGINGVDICNEIRKNKDTQKLPIILVSANKDIKASAAKAQFDDVIAKPFDMYELLGKIKKITETN